MTSLTKNICQHIHQRPRARSLEYQFDLAGTDHDFIPGLVEIDRFQILTVEFNTHFGGPEHFALGGGRAT